MIARPLPPPPSPKPAPELRPGANVRMGRNPLGMWIEGPTGGADFRHPFTVTPAGGETRVSMGLILADIAVQPLIGTVPIGGDDKHPQPLLKLSEDMVNDLGESWVCVEVTPTADGKLDPDGKASKVEVVQRKDPMSTMGKTGRAPLALLVNKNGRWQVFQIAMFHFRYETSLPTSGARKHFFL